MSARSAHVRTTASPPVRVVVVVGVKKKENTFNWALICAGAFLVGAVGAWRSPHPPRSRIPLLKSQSKSTASNGALVTSATPAFVLLFASWLLHERITARRLLALALATSGVIAVIDPRTARLDSVSRKPRNRRSSEEESCL